MTYRKGRDVEPDLDSISQPEFAIDPFNDIFIVCTLGDPCRLFNEPPD
jgi:hypothetical protein